MNMILHFLNENCQRFDLARYGATGRLSTLVITPRFQASSHVVFMIWGEQADTPVLVAKTPRLKGATASLQREVSNLRLIHAQHPDGFVSVPQVVAYDTYHEYPILVETALTGQPMDPGFTRRHRNRCCQAVVNWLIDLQQSGTTGAQDEAWFERLVERPIRYFSQRFPVSTKEAQLLLRTKAVVAPLRTLQLPLVFEHGDLSHPNLLLLPSGEPGVLDWELADPAGLPACDLFLFLTYVAFATHDAQASGAYQAAFQAAFFGQAAWTKPYVRQYAQQLHLPEAALTPLFVMTWLRYIVSQLVRLDDGQYRDVDEITKCKPETAQWLRQNRYYALWDYALNHAEQLKW
ncbi:MAG: aminoglycoside phosphotransferase family protein [Caldilineaceae bacterium]